MFIKSGSYHNPTWLAGKKTLNITGIVIAVCENLPKNSELKINLKKSGAGFYLLLANSNPKTNFNISINHFAQKTKSILVSSLISKQPNEINIRALVTLGPRANGSQTITEFHTLGENTEKILQEPKLEIHSTPQIAAHATTAGHFDEKQLVYLSERGLPKDTAQRLLAAAFLDHWREKFFTLVK